MNSCYSVHLLFTFIIIYKQWQPTLNWAGTWKLHFQIRWKRHLFIHNNGTWLHSNMNDTHTSIFNVSLILSSLLSSGFAVSSFYRSVFPDKIRSYLWFHCYRYRYLILFNKHSVKWLNDLLQIKMVGHQCCKLQFDCPVLCLTTFPFEMEKSQNMH